MIRRSLRWARRHVWAIAGSLFGALLVAIVVLGVLLLLSVRSTVNDHNSELKTIKKLVGQVHKETKATAKLSKTHNKELDTIKQQGKNLANAEVTIGQYAAALQAEISANHNTSSGNFVAICAALPSCTLPPPS